MAWTVVVVLLPLWSIGTLTYALGGFVHSAAGGARRGDHPSLSGTITQLIQGTGVAGVKPPRARAFAGAVCGACSRCRPLLEPLLGLN